MQRHVAPTNRDKSPVWALFGLFGYDCERFIRATQGEISHVRVSVCVPCRNKAAHVFSHKTQ